MLRCRRAAVVVVVAAVGLAKGALPLTSRSVSSSSEREAENAISHGTVSPPSASTTGGGSSMDPRETASRVASGRQGHYSSAYYRQRLRRQRSRDGAKRRGSTAFQEGEAEEGFPFDSTVPMVHPGAQDLPPLEASAPTKPKFSFLSHPSQKTSRDYWSQGEVPNNTPKPLLPMWASSLTSPALGKQRLVEENWISRDGLGTVDAADTAGFASWLAGKGTPLAAQLSENVELHLRRSFQRGVYARRDIKAGEVVLTIPLTGTMEVAGGAEGRQEEDAAPEANQAPLWATSLNAETLRRHSVATRDRVVPSYAEVKAVLRSTHRSSFDPVPHPLFVDQVHFALLLACEKAEGPASALFPYLRLFQKPTAADRVLAGEHDAGESALMDDEFVKELHLGVLDPVTHMEFNDHRNRFTHYLRELHRAWWDSYETERKRRARAQDAGKTVPVEQPEGTPTRQGDGRSEDATTTTTFTPVPPRHRGERSVADPLPMSDAMHRESCQTMDAASPNETGLSDPSSAVDDGALGLKPPPSLADMEWAFRFVLSRQRILPGLRHATADLDKESTEDGYDVENEKLDPFARAVMRGKWAFYQHVLRVVEEARLRVNDFDPSSIATVVPLLDMFNHPPSGRANVDFSVENLPLPTPPPPAAATTTRGAGEAEGVTRGEPASAPHLVVRAIEDVEALDELTVLFPKCYSVSYSLYRFGFLALRSREDDMTELMKANRVDGELRRLSASGERGRRPAGLWSGLVGRLLGRAGREESPQLPR